MVRIALRLILHMLFLYSGVLSAQHIDTICPGSGTFMYGIDEEAGHTYEWKIQGGRPLSSLKGSSVLVEWPYTPGLYKLSVTARNKSGCSSDPSEQYVYVKKKLITVNAPTEACINSTISIHVNGGMHFNWSTGDSLSTAFIRIVSDTLITLVVKDTVCSISVDTFLLPVKALFAPKPFITKKGDDVYKGQLVDLGYSRNSGENPAWSIDKGLIRDADAGGIKVSFLDTGIARVKLVVTNSFGCADSAEKELYVKGEHIYFPTGFSPGNNDGLNDEFRPYGQGIRSWRMEVYNRWGELVYSGNETQPGWRGQSGNVAAQDDSYIYLCEGYFMSGRMFAHKGTITIVR